MSRPPRRARSSSQTQVFGQPKAAQSLPRRPVLLYVDLHEVPNILEEYHSLPEAHQLTQNNLPDHTTAEELAFLTFLEFFRFEGLDISSPPHGHGC